jgi:hypothetical protein
MLSTVVVDLAVDTRYNYCKQILEDYGDVITTFTRISAKAGFCSHSVFYLTGWPE